MRSLLITFRAIGKGVDFTGDLVADLPDDVLFDKRLVNELKTNIKTSFDAQLAEPVQITGTEPSSISHVVLLAVIPLETVPECVVPNASQDPLAGGTPAI